MTDAIDLQSVLITRSPDVAGWAKTLRITRIACTAAGGFVIDFDQVIPDRWKWPSAPPPSTDNFQFTVWIVLKIGGLWQGAGFVQMWQGRPMGTRALPPIFADVDGVPGYRNWWGDPRKFWGAMSEYLPADGDQIGILVTAGNGRLTDGITSVAERSNVVLYTLRANDAGNQVYLDADPAPDPVEPPVVVPPSVPPIVPPEGAVAALFAELDEIKTAIAEVKGFLLAQALKTPPLDAYVVKVPYLGTAPIVLIPPKVAP